MKKFDEIIEVLPYVIMLVTLFGMLIYDTIQFIN